jgi:hypothetical protein
MGIKGWYVLLIHRKVKQFLRVVFKPNKAIKPVFTDHSDHHYVSKTSFPMLETTARKVKTDMAAMQTSVNRVNGNQGNVTPGAAATTTGQIPH